METCTTYFNKKTQRLRDLNSELIHKFNLSTTKIPIELFSTAIWLNYEVHLEEETRKNNQKNPDKRRAKEDRLAYTILKHTIIL